MTVPMSRSIQRLDLEEVSKNIQLPGVKETLCITIMQEIVKLILILLTLTFFQLRILIDLGGVGADSLQFKVASKPIAGQPDAVVSSTFFSHIP